VVVKAGLPVVTQNLKAGFHDCCGLYSTPGKLSASTAYEAVLPV
jgi:hypothetical protein